MAQRMESVAPPGGVMLSESTARLVENLVSLEEPELVAIKGAAAPVPASRLLAIGEHQARRRSDSPLVGRTWELNTVTALLDEAVGGAGAVVTIVGPPGIGKSRLVREAVANASNRGVPVLTTYCESHTRDIPFHVVARLLRDTTGIEGVGPAEARARVRIRLPGADPDDLLLVEDLLGIRDSETAPPEIGPDARRRRLTALDQLSGARKARADPRGHRGRPLDRRGKRVDAGRLHGGHSAGAVADADHLPARISRNVEPAARRADHRAATVERCAHNGIDDRDGRGRPVTRHARRPRGRPIGRKPVLRGGDRAGPRRAAGLGGSSPARMRSPRMSTTSTCLRTCSRRSVRASTACPPVPRRH